MGTTTVDTCLELVDSFRPRPSHLVPLTSAKEAHPHRPPLLSQVLVLEVEALLLLLLRMYPLHSLLFPLGQPV